MHRERARLLQIKFVLCDLVVTTLAFLLSYWIRDSLLASTFGEIYPLPSYLWILLVAIVSLPVIFIALKIYEVDGVVEEKTPFYRKAASPASYSGRATAS